MYSIIWRYKIKKGSDKEFEFEYGKEGAWSNLFKNSNNYLGSFLHKSLDMNQMYLLIDTWTSEQSYKDFINLNGSVYNSLSSRFEKLYDSEEKIGAFNAIN